MLLHHSLTSLTINNTTINKTCETLGAEGDKLRVDKADSIVSRLQLVDWSIGLQQKTKSLMRSFTAFSITCVIDIRSLSRRLFFSQSVFAPTPPGPRSEAVKFWFEWSLRYRIATRGHWFDSSLLSWVGMVCWCYSDELPPAVRSFDSFVFVFRGLERRTTWMMKGVSHSAFVLTAAVESDAFVFVGLNKRISWLPGGQSNGLNMLSDSLPIRDKLASLQRCPWTIRKSWWYWYFNLTSKQHFPTSAVRLGLTSDNSLTRKLCNNKYYCICYLKLLLL